MENRSKILHLAFFLWSCGRVRSPNDVIQKIEKRPTVIANRQYWFLQQETSTLVGVGKSIGARHFHSLGGNDIAIT